MIAIATRPKEIGLLFKPDMFRATLEDRKTNTRRVVIPSQSAPRIPPLELKPWIINGTQETIKDLPAWIGSHPDYPMGEKWFTCPYGQKGDRYYLKEPTQIIRLDTDGKALVLYPYDGSTIWCDITESDLERIEARKDWSRTATARFMLKSFARHWRECVSTRPERLQDISEEDAIAEGIEPIGSFWKNYTYSSIGGYMSPTSNPITSFRTLWNSINESRGHGWDKNDWVWRVEYRRVEA